MAQLRAATERSLKVPRTVAGEAEYIEELVEPGVDRRCRPQDLQAMIDQIADLAAPGLDRPPPSRS
jgi:hypothetical protein